MTIHIRKLTPRLIVADAARAIAFYVEALGAKELARYVDRSAGGTIVHAELAVGDVTFTLADARHAWHNHAPPAPGTSPVVLTLEADDADALGARLQRAGAKVVFPLADRDYGYRDGRFVDPFGHLWIVSQELAPVAPEVIQRRLDDAC
jgi:PhnB protein